MRRVRLAGRDGGRGLIALAACMALAVGVAARADSGPGVSVAESVVSVEVAERVAVTKWAIRLTARGEGWQQVRLTPAAVALRSAALSGGQGYLDKGVDGCVAHVRGPGEFKVDLSAVLDVASQGGERYVRLPMINAFAVRCRVEVAQGGLTFKAWPECPLESSTPIGRSVADLYPLDADWLMVRWVPAAAVAPRAPIFEAQESSALRLDSGAIRRCADLTLAVQRGEVGEVTLEAPGETDVLGVSTPPGAPDLIESWRLAGTADARRVVIRLAQAAKDRLQLRVDCEQLFNGATVSVRPFVVAGALRQTGRFSVADTPAMKLIDAGSTAVAPGDAAARTSVQIFEFVKPGAVLRLKAVAAPSRVTAFAATHVRLQAGVVETTASFDLRIEGNAVDRLRIGLDEGMVVLDVLGDGIDRWSVADNAIETRLARPVAGAYTLTVRCLQNLRRVNGVLVPRLRCLDAERESGAIAVSAGPDIALQHYKSQKVTQVDPDRLPDWLRRLKPKLAYLYDQPDGSLAVKTDLAQPVLRAEVFGVARVYDDLIREEHLFLCEVERRPVFNMVLRLPEGLNVVSLAGDAVQDWETAGNGQVVTVALRRGVIGRTQLQLVAERRLGTERAQLPMGGVSLMGAERIDGWFGVVTSANVDLRAVASPGLTPVDIRKAPQLLTAYRDLRLAFQWSAGDWSLRCAGTPVQPRIDADVSTTLLFSAGAVRVRSEIVWHIARARVSRLTVTVPDDAVDLSVNGDGIRSQEETGRSSLLLLDDPITGDYTAVVTYIQLADRAGGIPFRPPSLPEAERVRGVVGAYVRDAQIEVAAKALHNASRSDSAPRLDSGALPLAGAYAYSDPDTRIDFQLKGYAMADGVVIAAEQCRMSTVVKDAGQAVTYLTCQVRHAGAQYFTLSLPPKSQLWGAYVLGAPVRANRLADGRLQVPIQDAPRGPPFEVGIIWSEPVAELGMAGALRLASPQLALPAQSVDWNLYLPADYQLVRSGGNMKPVFQSSWEREGIPGLAVDCSRRSWPVVRSTIEIVGWILVLAGVCAIIWALVWARMCWLRKHPKEEVRRTPRPQVLIETLAVLAILAILAGMLLPALGSSREKSRRTCCMNNLTQIRRAIDCFKEDHNGSMPESLAQLYPAYVSDMRVFRCPQSEAECGYEYSGPIPRRANAREQPVVWDRAENHDDGFNVLYSDGSVSWVGTPGGSRDRTVCASQLAQMQRGIYAYTQNSADFFPQQRAQGAMRSFDNEEIGQSARKPVTAQPPSPTAAPAPLDLKSPKKGGYVEQSVKEKQLAQAYFNRGDLDKAAESYKRILQNAPANQEAQEGLDRIAGLKARLPQQVNGAGVISADGVIRWQGSNHASNDPKDNIYVANGPAALRGADTDAFLWDGTQVKTESLSAGALAAYAQQLKRDATKGWEDEVADAGLQRDIVALAAGEKSQLKLSGGGRVEFKDGDFSVSGRVDDRRAVEAATSAVREKMLAKARELTAAQKRREAELDAQRRAQIELRKNLSFASKGKGGTLTRSRGAGAMPLEIRFPNFGTRAYPFHMDFAGASQARIEVSCIRSGAALVAQGFVGLAVFALLALLAWRRPRVGAAFAAVVLLLCAVGLTGDDHALSPYLVMALAAASCAVGVALARWLIARRSQTSHIFHPSHS